MKHIIILMGLFSFFNTHAQIERVEPPFWWEGMQYAEVQILLYGKNIAQYRVESDLPITNVLKTENPNNILGTFSTISSLDHGTPESRKAALFNGFINEFVGSFVLFFAALGLTKNFFGAEALQYLKPFIEQSGQQLTDAAVKAQVAPHTAAGLSVDHLALGFLVMALVTSLGGPTGPGLNPARDLGPRILHFILPESVLGKHKGDSKWWYSWVPVVAPILAGITAVLLFKTIYG